MLTVKTAVLGIMPLVDSAFGPLSSDWLIAFPGGGLYKATLISAGRSLVVAAAEF